MKNWKQVVGKVIPWAIGAIGGLLETLGVHVGWFPTAGALIIGAVQLVLSLIPDKAAP